MVSASMAADALSDFEHRRELRRAVIASTIGTTIEWYDFLLYGIASGLVFAKLYFPQSDALTGTLQAYAVFLRFSANWRICFGRWRRIRPRRGCYIAARACTFAVLCRVTSTSAYKRDHPCSAALYSGHWWVASGRCRINVDEWARPNSSRGFVASTANGARHHAGDADVAVLQLAVR
jgi:hypothetical protein